MTTTPNCPDCGEPMGKAATVLSGSSLTSTPVGKAEAVFECARCATTIRETKTMTITTRGKPKA